MKTGERKAKRDGIYNTMEHDRDKDAERRFREPVKAYGKCQTMLELHGLMQKSDVLDDEDRRDIHRISVKHSGSRIEQQRGGDNGIRAD